MLLARDGVWRTVAPKEITTNQLEMTGASRADFAIRATADSWIEVDGTTVANIYINEDPADLSVHPFDIDGLSQWSAFRPDYLRNLMDETNVNMESVSMGARTINGSKYNNNVPTFSLPTNQVQEWKLSGAVQHPFHLHVYHVQALKTDNGFEEGEYYDVVSSKMSVRFDLNSTTSTVYNGRTILHCHILSHEDRGAMGWLDVLGGQDPPTYPAGTTYLEYYTLDGTSPPPTPPSGLSATATSSSSIDLAWTDNSQDEDGFDIERSTDGSSFTLLTSLGTNVIEYTDTELTASTTYWYRVSAYNSNGNSAYTNIANATTLQSGGDVELHVGSITVTRVALNGNRFRADATITILDGSAGQPVSGATVNGGFIGPTTGSESGTTDNNGEVFFSSRATKNPNGVWCFEVTDVSKAGATYNGGAISGCENSPFSRTINTTGTTDMHLSVYPNPFQNSTQIAFELPQQMHVVLEVYTVLGRPVAVITEQSYEAGQNFLDWDAHKLSSGMYFLKLKADGKLIDTQRLLLMR